MGSFLPLLPSPPLEDGAVVMVKRACSMSWWKNDDVVVAWWVGGWLFALVTLHSLLARAPILYSR
jgi:hypothetical protein